MLKILANDKRNEVSVLLNNISGGLFSKTYFCVFYQSSLEVCVRERSASVT